MSRAALTVFLAFASAHGVPAQAQPTGAQADAGAWVIGPILDGRNYSVGMPLHPTARRGGGFHIDLPRAPGSVHYVTFRHGPLTGKRRIRMRYRLEAEPGVQIVATTAPDQPGMITPYFQRSGDNWTARRGYEAYRWYGTFATRRLERGEFELVAPLSARWTAVLRSTAESNPAGFREAVADADQVGFVLGGGTGWGHGVHAVGGGRARLVVTHFSVE